MAAGSPLIVIPARIGSTRLKDKPLREIGGVPLIRHVAMRALEADIGQVVVSTDDERVLQATDGLDVYGVLCLPPNEHCGSDRVAWTAQNDLERDYIINLQGDLPFVDPQIIRDLWAKRQEVEADIVTAWTPISLNHYARMSDADLSPRERSQTTHTAHWHRVSVRTHVGLYAFTRAALARFASLPPTEIETRTRLEGWRASEAGMTFDHIEVDHMPLEINTESDLKHANLIASMLRGYKDTGSGD